MVAINESAWDKARKQSKMDANGLTAYDLEILGKSVRIDIPFRDPAALVQVADMLRGLANQIDFTVQRDDVTLRQRLQMLKSEAAMVNRRIRLIHGATSKEL